MFRKLQVIKKLPSIFFPRFFLTLHCGQIVIIPRKFFFCTSYRLCKNYVLRKCFSGVVVKTFAPFHWCSTTIFWCRKIKKKVISMYELLKICIGRFQKVKFLETIITLRYVVKIGPFFGFWKDFFRFGELYLW